MADFDVFNGDADGICALQQLRLSRPLSSNLVTGVKRDIALLKKVNAAAGDSITVLDVSLDKNLEPLLRLLEKGASVSYFDHHFAGKIPDHPALDVHIDPTPDRGTCFLVDQTLDGQYRAWAVVGTFGDNFDHSARKMAEPLQLQEQQLARLQELGILINYNGYGAEVEDLHIPPADLFRRIHPYSNPLEFMAEDEAMVLLRDGYRADMEMAEQLVPELQSPSHGLYVLPNQSWSRRVSGVFANQLAQGAPARAHAILTELGDGGFLVSVRAPLDRPTGADQLCRGFSTGGGREAAAGINHLSANEFDRFRKEFESAFISA